MASNKLDIQITKQDSSALNHPQISSGNKICAVGQVAFMYANGDKIFLISSVDDRFLTREIDPPSLLCPNIISLESEILSDTDGKATTIVVACNATGITQMHLVSVTGASITFDYLLALPSPGEQNRATVARLAEDAVSATLCSKDTSEIITYLISIKEAQLQIDKVLNWYTKAPPLGALTTFKGKDPVGATAVTTDYIGLGSLRDAADGLKTSFYTTHERHLNGDITAGTVFANKGQVVAVSCSSRGVIKLTSARAVPGGAAKFNEYLKDDKKYLKRRPALVTLARGASVLLGFCALGEITIIEADAKGKCSLGAQTFLGFPLGCALSACGDKWIACVVTDEGGLFRLCIGHL